MLALLPKMPEAAGVRGPKRLADDKTLSVEGALPHVEAPVAGWPVPPPPFPMSSAMVPLLITASRMLLPLTPATRVDRPKRGDLSAIVEADDHRSGIAAVGVAENQRRIRQSGRELHSALVCAVGDADAIGIDRIHLTEVDRAAVACGGAGPVVAVGPTPR